MSTYDGPPGQFPPSGQTPQGGAFQQPAADGKGKKVALIGGLGAGAVVLGGGAIAASMFFSQGVQPAEALPADTIAYASLDLDPSGGQKLEIIKTLRKFPAFTDATDIDEDTDLIGELFEKAVTEGDCDGLNYADDVKPWIGSRAAVAAVKGADAPTAVFVLNVKDSGAAQKGIDRVIDECGGDSGEVAVAVEGDWAIFGESQEVVDSVVTDAAEESLAADVDYQRWTDEAGGEAIVSMYLSRHVAQYADELLDATGGLTPGFPSGSSGLYGQGDSDPFGDDSDMFGDDSSPYGEDDFSTDLFGDDELSDPYSDPYSQQSEAAKEQVKEMLKDFTGAAMAVRFADGGLELEVAGGLPEETAGQLTPEGADLVKSLPADTVAALGFGYQEDWLDAVAEQLEKADAALDLDSMLSEVGLTRDDVEQGLGDAVALALGSGIDVNAIANGGPEEIPAGVKIKADVDDVNNLVGKLDETFGAQLGGSLYDGLPWLKAEGDDDVAVISPKADFRASLLDPDDELGDTKEYRSVVDKDAQGVLFVNFNADNDWLVRAAADAGDDVTDNLEPLAALAVSWWSDEDVTHMLVRLTTD